MKTYTITVILSHILLHVWYLHLVFSTKDNPKCVYGCILGKSLGKSTPRCSDVTKRALLRNPFNDEAVDGSDTAGVYQLRWVVEKSQIILQGLGYIPGSCVGISEPSTV